MPQKTEVCSQLTDAQILGAIKEELKHMPIPFPNRIQRVTIDSEAYVILEYPKNEGPDAPGILRRQARFPLIVRPRWAKYSSTADLKGGMGSSPARSILALDSAENFGRRATVR